MTTAAQESVKNSLTLVIGSGSAIWREYILRSISDSCDIWLFTAGDVTWESPYIIGSTRVNTLDAAATIEAAADLDRRLGVGGVLSHDEIRVSVAAAVAEALGLPGGGAEAVASCRDKASTRERFSTGGVPQPSSYAVSSFEEADSIGYPVVVKPRAPAGSMGVAHRTRPFLTVACALTDVVTALTGAVICALLLTSASPFLSVPVALAGCVLIARQLRALENLTHEASHYNWSRHHRRWNDVLGWLLSGLPTDGRLSAYRESHLRHHGRFGTLDDPDRRRYAELDLEALNRTSPWAFASSVVVRITRYQIGWLREVKTDLLASAGILLWSAVCAALPATLLGGPVTGVLAEVVWLASAFVVLPVLRLIAEADEHIYSDCDTVFDATISNVGLVQRVLIHPHADGYHTVHHLWPGIPHHALRRVHRTLMTHDPDYARRIRMRRGVLDTPRATTSDSYGKGV